MNRHTDLQKKIRKAHLSRVNNNGGKQTQETQAITRHADRTNKLRTLVQEMCYIWQPVLSLK